MAITVYSQPASQPACVQCHATYRALDSKGLEYTVIDISQNDAARDYVVEELGYRQAPVVVIDDEDHWSGFRPDQISRIAAL